MLNTLKKIFPTIVLILFVVSFIIFSPFSRVTREFLFCRISNPFIDDYETCHYVYESTPHFDYCYSHKDPKCFAKIFTYFYYGDADFWSTYSVPNIDFSLKEIKLDNAFEPLLEDKDWEVRAGAVLLIGYLKRTQSKKLLYKMLKDNNHVVVDNANIVLDCFNGKDCKYQY